ncbi:hypothetical protein [Philodulcilactobacillus myokoensis]|uniref:hypothetical protein n=1 Tax=Philodulcilactobacillus myokoensis TaxID=2929573 RepID=UPI0025705F10|nr:hypothetical protein [Philodulcilactobacillus myokoensis]
MFKWSNINDRTLMSILILLTFMEFIVLSVNSSHPQNGMNFVCIYTILVSLVQIKITKSFHTQNMIFRILRWEIMFNIVLAIIMII